MRKTIKSQSVLLLVAVLIVMSPVRPAAAEQRIAASDTTARPANSAPRIGLALGGGGAKGAAHIGVLKVLEELRVPISCIAGTSMGALIGGSYAAGNTAEEIEQTVLGIDWQRTIGGRDQRKLMPIDRKIRLQNYSNSLEVGISDGGIKGSGGIIKTQIIEDQIRTLVSRVPATGDFDDLPIPFRATATEMVRGELAVIGEGNVAQAMRASMALPGIFAPVRIGDQVLGDGGMMRNLPVDIVREQCADIVIAVWMTMPDPDPDNIVSTVSMLNRSFEVMVGANETQSIASLGRTDIGIAVPMGDMTSQDFLRVADAARFGEEEARRHIDELRKYSVPEEEYVAWRQSVEGELYGNGHIREIRVVGSDRVNPDYVMANLRYAAPDVWIDAEKLAEDAENIYALGDFERVDYRVYAGKNGNVLEIRPVEKHWGPDFLRFDIGLATFGETDIQAILNLEHERTWINSLGGRWHNELQFGRNTIVSTSFYQPLDAKQRFFVEPIAHYSSNIEDVYLLDDRVASIDVRDLYAQLDFGYNMGTRAQLRAGIRRGAEEAKVSTGIPGLAELQWRYYTSGQIRAIYDTRNSVALPTSGTYFNARYIDSLSSLGGVEDFRSIEGILSKAFLLNGNSLSFVVSGGDALKGELPVSRDIKLGGIRTFPGLRPGELRGTQYWYAGGAYLWRVADLAELFGQAIYAGVRLQSGEVRGAPVGLNQGQLWGVSGTLNGQTPIGAFTLSLAWVSNDNVRLQFSLGRPILEGSILDESH